MKKAIIRVNESNRIEAIYNFVGFWDYWIYNKSNNKLIAVFKTKKTYFKGILGCQQI